MREAVCKKIFIAEYDASFTLGSNSFRLLALVSLSSNIFKV